MGMTHVSLYNIIMETKIKVERNKRYFSDNIPKVREKFLDSTGMSEEQWNVIYNYQPIKCNADFENLIDILYQ